MKMKVFFRRELAVLLALAMLLTGITVYAGDAPSGDNAGDEPYVQTVEADGASFEPDAPDEDAGASGDNEDPEPPEDPADDGDPEESQAPEAPEGDEPEEDEDLEDEQEEAGDGFVVTIDGTAAHTVSVSYEKAVDDEDADGGAETVAVSSGDTVPQGAELTIAVAPGGLTLTGVYLRSGDAEEFFSAPEDGADFSVSWTVAEDVYLSVNELVGVMPTTVRNTVNSGGGLFTGTVTSQTELNAALNAYNRASVDYEIRTWTSAAAYTPSYGTDEFDFLYDAFSITLDGNVDYTLYVASSGGNAGLDGRSIYIGATSSFNGTLTITGVMSTSASHSVQYEWKNGYPDGGANSIFRAGDFTPSSTTEANRPLLSELSTYRGNAVGAPSNAISIPQRIWVTNNVNIKDVNITGGQGEVILVGTDEDVTTRINVSASDGYRINMGGGALKSSGNITLSNVGGITAGTWGSYSYSNNSTGMTTTNVAISGMSGQSNLSTIYSTSGNVQISGNNTLLNTYVTHIQAPTVTISATNSGSSIGTIDTIYASNGAGNKSTALGTTISGFLTANTIYGHTSVTSYYDCIIGTIYARGYANLAGMGDIQYTNVYGGGTSATYTGLDGSVHSPNHSNGVTLNMSNGTVAAAGNFYGGNAGGAGSALSDSVEITISGGTILCDVYGGSADGGGSAASTSVTLNGGTVNASVYGGGDGSAVTGSSSVAIGGASITGSVYGGGDGADVNTSNSNVNPASSVTLSSGSVYTNVFGGGSGGDVTGNSSVVMDGSGSVSNGGVYGGGSGGDVTGNSSVSITGTGDVGTDVYGGGDNGAVSGNSSVSITGTNNVIGGSVYGGGTGSNAAVSGSATVTIGGTGTIGTLGGANGNVYGGGDGNTVNNTVVTISGKIIYGHVYGGGYNGQVVNTSSPVDPATDVSVTGGTITGSVYGGGYNNGSNSDVNGNTSVFVTGGRVGVDVFGGGLNADILGTTGTVVMISGSSTAVVGNVYGGCNNGDVTANTDVTVQSSAVVGYVYGGGHNGSVNDTNGGTDVKIKSGSTVNNNVYGGGSGSGTVANNTSVEITSATVGTSSFVGTVYGGGKDNNTVINNTAVTVHNGSRVYFAVFGGGQDNSWVGGTTDVTIGQATPSSSRDTTIIGGADAHKPVATTYSGILGDTTTYGQSGHVFGGGDYRGTGSPSVGGTTTLTIQNLATVPYGRVSGGSLGATSNNTRKVVLINLGYATNGSYAEDYYTYPNETPNAYVTFFSLQDYTEADATNCYMTVYFHLSRAVGIQTTGHVAEGITYDLLDLYGYDLPYTSYTTANSPVFRMSSGVYRPWRPTVTTPDESDDESQSRGVLIEPRIYMDTRNTHLRMQHDFTLQFDIGGIYDYSGNPLGGLPLRIDRYDLTAAVLAFIYGADETVNKTDTFDLTVYLPTTVQTKDSADAASILLGIEIYIPPSQVDTSSGSSTNSGGTSSSDRRSGGSSSGGGGGGGGGTGGVVTGATGAGLATLQPVSVDQTAINAKVRTAIGSVIAGTTAVVRETQATQISASVLRSMYQTALEAVGTVVLRVSTMNGEIEEGVMILDPAKALELEGTIQLGVYTRAAKIETTLAIFDKFFSNKIAVVHLEHEGKIGMEVEVIAKVDLSELNTESLVFYSYSHKTNTYHRILAPKYSIDANGWLHFSTSVGNDIIVTDQLLQRK